MPISRADKEAQVASLAEKLKRSNSVVVTHYHGLTVRELQEFRKDLKEVEVDYQVAKISLFHLAAKEAGITLEDMEGPIAVAIGYGDPVQTSKAVNSFAKDHEAMELVGGVMDGNQVDVATIKKLAALPGREELLGKLVGSLSAPPRNLAGALAAIPRNLVYALNAVKEQKA
jgi:large subunit ribosomal protein L10